MSASTVSRFFDKLGKNNDLAGEYWSVVSKAMRAAVWPAIAEMAAREGLAFSTEELEQWLTSKQGELSDEALEGITGGAKWTPPPSGLGWIVAGAIGTVCVAGITADTGSDNRQPISP